MQRMPSKNCDKCGIVLSEIRLFLENHLLEFHEVWYKISNSSIQKDVNFNKGNARYSSDPSI